MDLNDFELTLLVLFSASETLSLVPFIKQNSVFQVFYDIIKAAKPIAQDLIEKIKNRK